MENQVALLTPEEILANIELEHQKFQQAVDDLIDSTPIGESEQALAINRQILDEAYKAKIKAESLLLVNRYTTQVAIDTCINDEVKNWLNVAYNYYVISLALKLKRFSDSWKMAVREQHFADSVFSTLLSYQIN